MTRPKFLIAYCVNNTWFQILHLPTKTDSGPLSRGRGRRSKTQNPLNFYPTSLEPPPPFSHFIFMKWPGQVLRPIVYVKRERTHDKPLRRNSPCPMRHAFRPTTQKSTNKARVEKRHGSEEQARVPPFERTVSWSSSPTRSCSTLHPQPQQWGAGINVRGALKNTVSDNKTGRMETVAQPGASVMNRQGRRRASAGKPRDSGHWDTAQC